MARPPIGNQTMAYTVKFRLSDADMEDLKDIAGTTDLSTTLRRLIKDEKKRRGRRSK